MLARRVIAERKRPSRSFLITWFNHFFSNADGFCDLEGALCDCISMASIAAQIAANSRADGELIFAVCHVSEMLDALKVKYYAAYNGETAIEP